MRKRQLLAGLAIAGFALFATAGVAAAQTTPPTTIKFADEAAKQCFDKLEKGGTIDDCQKAPSPILPAANEMIWGSISFLILLALMWKFALPPVRKMMEAREDRIRGDLERAEAAKGESEQVLEQYRAQLADARNEASRILEDARQAADQMRRDLIARAEADANDLRARAQEDIRLASERALADLRTRVSELSIELAEKIVEHNLDRDTQLQLIENYINEVGTSS
ncbi:MAG: synthase, subunit b [Actinomycetia bacterium]|nr:synthase, subunit b [Actinomycetes bacterium]